MLYRKTLVPDGYVVPEILETDRFLLRKLTIADLDKDFEAVTSSADHLRDVFGPGQDWPAGLTRERDLADLGWHETEFNMRTSFAYTVMSLDESVCLGCVYFYPSAVPVFDALCILWVRSSVLDEGLDDVLFDTVKQWLADSWPFRRVGFPGRAIEWDELNGHVETG